MCINIKSSKYMLFFHFSLFSFLYFCFCFASLQFSYVLKFMKKGWAKGQSTPLDFQIFITNLLPHKIFLILCRKTLFNQSINQSIYQSINQSIKNLIATWYFSMQKKGLSAVKIIEMHEARRISNIMNETYTI